LNHKINLYFVFILFLLSLVIAPCPPDCQEQQQEYTSDKFAEDFKNDPVGTAKNHPLLYMDYLKENPNAVILYPEAYKTVITDHPERINQNKPAFEQYIAATEQFTISIQGNIKGYDTTNGIIETRGAGNEKVSSFTMDSLRGIEKSGGHSFRVNQDGRLVYKSIGVTGVEEDFFVSGELNYDDSLSLSYLVDGSISLANDAFEIELIGKTEMRFSNSCEKISGIKPCGFLFVSNGDPISLPSGVLTKGSAIIRNTYPWDVDLMSDSQFIIGGKTVIENTQPLHITDKVSSCNRFDASCIVSDLLSSKLQVRAIDNNEIKITTEDKFYDNIAVTPLSGDAKVNLRLQKQDGNSAVEIEFSKSKPLLRGNLQGLKTNIAHSFPDEKFSNNYNYWLIYGGEPIENTIGETNQLRLDNILKMFDNSEINEEALFLLLDTQKSIDEGDTKLLLYHSRDKDIKFIEEILSHYAVSSSTENEKTYRHLRIIISLKQGLESKGESSQNIDLMNNLLLEQLDQVPPSEVDELMKLLVDDPESQRYFLENKVFDISQPDKVLSLINSDELKLMVIERTKIIDITCKTCMYFDRTIEHLSNYLDEVRKLEESTGQDGLIELAINNLNFEAGVFKDDLGVKGQAFRKILITIKDDRELLLRTLERIPSDDDIGFNPRLFKEIYFNSYFGQKMVEENIDQHAISFSIALAAQRYLDERGIQSFSATDENIKNAVDLIINEREDFSKREILGPSTYYIPFTHNEVSFSNEEMVARAKSFGVTNFAGTDFKGQEHKGNILRSISESRDKGLTTIHFQGHGSPTLLGLSPPLGTFEEKDELRLPDAISWLEMGEALEERGDLLEVTILVDTCNGYSQIKKTLEYLSARGITELPTVITSSNRGSYGWENRFNWGLDRVPTDKKGLTGSDILNIVEPASYEDQDMSVTVPRNGFPQEVVSPIDDAGYSGEPKEEEDDYENRNSPVIEISKIEPEMQDMLDEMIV
jgi:hypothetical protein